jgi:multimeric flavodoxin WrbA
MGSPRGMKGNTGAVLEYVLQGMKSVGSKININLCLLSKLEVKFCQGCEVCLKTGVCPIKDDFNSIKNAMITADGIILASPNFTYNVSAQMKTLCDRIYDMIHCQMLYHKHSAVVTSGGGDYEPAQQYLTSVLEKLGCWRVGSIGGSTIQLSIDEERERIYREARELGIRLVQAIQTNQLFPDQAEDLECFFKMMKALVTLQKDQWQFDYSYWQKRWGLTDE